MNCNRIAFGLLKVLIAVTLAAPCRCAAQPDPSGPFAQGISVVAINYCFVKQASAAGIEPPVKAPLHDAARAARCAD